MKKMTQEGMKKEEEARLSLLDERIVSIQQSRDLLQQRADQQSYEIAELRKLERQRVQEQDVFLKNEAQLRMAAEKEVEVS
jgi:predicted nucleotidyltransferase